MAKHITINAGSGFYPLLTLLFVGLKLTGHIGWSWFWVVSPMWLPIAIVLTIMLILFGISLLLKLLT